MSEEVHPPIGILPSALAETQGDRPFVAIVRSRQELCRWLSNPPPGLRWLQVEGMLGDPEAWTEAAHSDSNIPLDVVVSDPALEFPIFTDWWMRMQSVPSGSQCQLLQV